MEDQRNVGENSCNSGDGTDQTGPILDVYDDDDVHSETQQHIFLPYWLLVLAIMAIIRPLLYTNLKMVGYIWCVKC